MKSNRLPRWTMVLGVLVLFGTVASLCFQSQAKAEPVDEKAQPAQPEKEFDPFEGLPVPPEFQQLFKGLQNQLDPQQRQEFQRQMNDARRQVEEMMKRLGAGGGFPFPQGRGGAFPGFPNLGGGFGRVAPPPEKARLGVKVAKPTDAMAFQLDLPENQGLVIEEIQANSAAEKAGLKVHDVLLEIDGQPVDSNPRALADLLKKIESEKALNVVVLRKGKNETLKGLKLPKPEKPEAREERGTPRIPQFRFPRLGGNVPFPGGFGGGNGSSMSMQVGPDGFTSKLKEQDVDIVVKGAMNNGKAEVDSITIKEGDESHTYEKVADVPEKYKVKVTKMLPNGKGIQLRNNGRRLQID